MKLVHVALLILCFASVPVMVVVAEYLELRFRVPVYLALMGAYTMASVWAAITILERLNGV